jgi:hypothetical protein
MRCDHCYLDWDCYLLYSVVGRDLSAHRVVYVRSFIVHYAGSDEHLCCEHAYLVCIYLLLSQNHVYILTVIFVDFLLVPVIAFKRFLVYMPHFTYFLLFSTNLLLLNSYLCISLIVCKCMLLRSDFVCLVIISSWCLCFVNTTKCITIT